MGILRNVGKKIGGLSKGKKIALGVGAAVGAAALGYGAYKLGKKFLKVGRHRSRGISRLRMQVQKARLQRLKIVEQRKLFKEQMKV